MLLLRLLPKSALSPAHLAHTALLVVKRCQDFQQEREASVWHRVGTAGGMNAGAAGVQVCADFSGRGQGTGVSLLELASATHLLAARLPSPKHVQWANHFPGAQHHTAFTHRSSSNNPQLAADKDSACQFVALQRQAPSHPRAQESGI